MEILGVSWVSRGAQARAVTAASVTEEAFHFQTYKYQRTLGVISFLRHALLSSILGLGGYSYK